MDDDRALMARIAAALERLAPPPFVADLSGASAFRWSPHEAVVHPAASPKVVPLDLLLAAESQKDALLANTRRFAAGQSANNALLWGARGTGKSALIKAVHKAVLADAPNLKLVEAPPDTLERIGVLIDALRAQSAPVILFFDDLAFAGGEEALKALKPALDGSLATGSGRVIVYATSNRRHLVARDARENTPDDLMWTDTAEERLALADRFGLWLGFHAIDQADYLAMIRAYARRFGLSVQDEDLHREALLWSRTRGARSGRTAWQFILDLAGRLGASTDL
ncbi:MAG: ATP-binding protein [Caulobacterales bacterium]